MKFLDGFIGTAGVFLERKVTIDVVDGMYELAVQQWGAREAAKLDSESLQQLSEMVCRPDYLNYGFDLRIQQEYGILNLSIPAWAVRQLHHDLAHGNIQLPYLHC
jgi:hypothetical protein